MMVTIGGRGWSFSGSTSSRQFAGTLEQLDPRPSPDFLTIEFDVLLDGDERRRVEVDRPS